VFPWWPMDDWELLWGQIMGLAGVAPHGQDTPPAQAAAARTVRER
jgi:hypothetical protein